MKQTLEQRLNISLGLIAFTIMIPTMFSMLATSTVTVALPHIAGAFGSTRDEVNWVVTSYMIAHGIMLPLTGWLENFFGRRNFLKLISAIFGIGSIICLFAPNLNILILGRIIQGIGGGPFMPLSQAILLQTFPKKQHGLAMGIFSLAVMVSAIIGPGVGGFLADNLSWEWSFIINIPVIIFSIIMIHCNIMENPNRQKVFNPDVVGITSLIVWLLSMQVVLDKGQQYGWFDCDWICWLSGFSLVTMVFFIVWELEYKNSITNLRVFKNWNFFIGTILGSFVNMVSYVTLVTLPMYLQNLMGYTAQLGGMALVPRGISCVVALFVVAKLVNYIDNRMLISVGFIILSLSTFMLTQINLELSPEYNILPNILFGIGLMMTFIPISGLALSTLPKEELAIGAGVHSLFKCVVTSFTISFANTLVARLSQVHQNYLVGNLSPHNPIFQLKWNALYLKFLHFTAPSVAQIKANGILYKQLLVQAKLMAFVDIFAIFALIGMCLIPMAFCLKISPKRQNT